MKDTKLEGPYFYNYKNANFNEYLLQPKLIKKKQSIN